MVNVPGFYKMFSFLVMFLQLGLIISRYQSYNYRNLLQSGPFSFLLPYSMPFNNKNKEGHRIREEGKGEMNEWSEWTELIYEESVII